jgi:hypothetical protein
MPSPSRPNPTPEPGRTSLRGAAFFLGGRPRFRTGITDHVVAVADVAPASQPTGLASEGVSGIGSAVTAWAPGDPGVGEEAQAEKAMGFKAVAGLGKGGPDGRASLAWTGPEDSGMGTPRRQDRHVGAGVGIQWILAGAVGTAEGEEVGIGAAGVAGVGVGLERVMCSRWGSGRGSGWRRGSRGGE